MPTLLNPRPRTLANQLALASWRRVKLALMAAARRSAAPLAPSPICESLANKQRASALTKTQDSTLLMFVVAILSSPSPARAPRLAAG